jgi:antitoxin component of MazEF toxin-antitoxin module
MKVAKWGNSLAVRLPASLVQELRIEEGDEIDLTPSGRGKFEVSADVAVQTASWIQVRPRGGECAWAV